MMIGQDFIKNGWDFHDDRLRFLWWQIKILLWTVEIFVIVGRDFPMNGRNFHYGESRFSWLQVEILLWTVEIFMMTGQDLYDDRPRLLFTMTGRDFSDNRLRFLWWKVEIFVMTAWDFANNSEIVIMNDWGFTWQQVEIFMFCLLFWHKSCPLAKVSRAFYEVK